SILLLAFVSIVVKIPIFDWSRLDHLVRPCQQNIMDMNCNSIGVKVVQGQKLGVESNSSEGLVLGRRSVSHVDTYRRSAWMKSGRNKVASNNNIIFIDYLPNQVHSQWLGRIFQQCSYVLEANIPNKR
ncbi:hypothetical protein U1Q18_039618, partial [Sarracenia purpurea var. burkii]